MSSFSFELIIPLSSNSELNIFLHVIIASAANREYYWIYFYIDHCLTWNWFSLTSLRQSTLSYPYSLLIAPLRWISYILLSLLWFLMDVLCFISSSLFLLPNWVCISGIGVFNQWRSDMCQIFYSLSHLQFMIWMFVGPLILQFVLWRWLGFIFFHSCLQMSFIAIYRSLHSCPCWLVSSSVLSILLSIFLL